MYCARPGGAFRRSLVKMVFNHPAATGPSTHTDPRWLTSNSPAAERTARCSAKTPLVYCNGISHPPNSVSRAPRERCRSMSGVVPMWTSVAHDRWGCGGLT